MSKRWPLQTRSRVVLTVAALVLTLPLSMAAAQGPGAGPGPGAPLNGGGTSLTTFTTADFAGSGRCAQCHSELFDRAGNNVAMDKDWRSTMMANAAKDPLWQAKIQSEVLRTPALKAAIEDKCSRCHTPMARTQAIADGTTVAVLDGGFLDPAHSLHEAARDGVSCALCHQVQNIGLGTSQTFTGGYIIDTSTVAPFRPIYAKFANVTVAPMQNSVGYTPMQGAQTTHTGFCGVCHVLYTPTVDAAGNVVGEFPEQMTYLEWEHSSLTRTCQDCHLPVAGSPVKLSNRPLRLPARSPFQMHHYVGGNAFLVTILRDHLAELGVTATADQLNTTAARITNQLAGGTTAALQATAGPVADGTLTVAVDVQNLSGHKLTSGIPTRRVWLHVTVVDAAGTVVFESGRPLADGQIAGDNQDAVPGTYEPHYDLINSADQVQIYETVMLNTDGQLTYTLLRADTYAKDNRLLPAGFDKVTAGPDISVYGAAATDANFVGGSDRVTYAIPVGGGRAPFNVSVELLYQATSHAFVEDLRTTSAALVQRFAGYYDQADKTPIRMAAVQVTAW